VGGVRKWQFLLIYSNIYADVGGGPEDDLPEIIM
jgi:hypothetical protein